MNDFFGIPMNTIMYVLLGMLILALTSVAYVALRNPIMFKLGTRNIPRRRAQTILIVLGLMLSTLIISAAFTTGDTVQRSVTSEVYSLLGSVDQTISVRGIDEDDDQGIDDPSNVSIQVQTFSQTGSIGLIDSLRQIPNVDAVVPVYSDVAVAVNMDKRQSSPLFTVTGLDPTSSKVLPDLQDISGGKLTVADLGPGEIYVNKAAADELEVKPGDSVLLFTQGKQSPFKVKAITEDTRLAGAAGVSTRREGGSLPLNVAQDLFTAPDRVSMIVVSNKGDARGGLQYSAQVTRDMKQALTQSGLDKATPTSPGLAVSDVKATGVDVAETGASILTTFFLALGLFSIAAGVMLIFLIFVMLATERKPEMGMARAVGTKRLDLVQIFLSEGMGYNILAAAVGTALGVLVSFGMSQVMAAIFANFDISISPHVTPRSLIISYSLGVVLTFLTVTFSSWRVSQINIVRAIRDIPEPPTPKPQWAAHGIIGTVLGLIFKPGDRGAWLRRGGLLIAGVVLSALAPPLGILLLVLWVFSTFKIGPLFVLLSIPLIMLGASSESSFPLLFGLSLLPLGLALILRSFGTNERLTYTLTGLVMLYIWEFDFSVGLIEKVFGKTDGGPEMFFLSGVMVTLAATFVVVYNADIILGPVTRIGKGFGALVPTLKMAVAYPLANRMRTGMTMAMFCLVVFALTVISSMNHNFNRLFISDRALGGWQVFVDENPNNPLGDLKAKLTEANSPAAPHIEAVGVSSLVGPRNARICQQGVNGNTCDPKQTNPSDAGFNRYLVRGQDAGFLSNAKVPLQSRAPGYDTDEDVWRAVANDPSLAIMDANMLASAGGFGGAGFVEGVDEQAQEMKPVKLTVMDANTRKTQDVTAIGIVELGASGTYTGLHMRESTVVSIFGKPDLRRFFVKTAPGSDNMQVARDIEGTLLTTGAQAKSLRHEIDQQSATFNGFFYLMQGFMGLGLFVGVAAVGVIAFRTVVERRQQIGMLRAIGYTKGMIGLTFLIESSFIAFMGVVSGVVFALILARQLIVQEFANQGVTTFSVPWPQVFVISGLAFGFALLMTLIPSRQAASIPIAEALRYE